MPGRRRVTALSYEGMAMELWMYLFIIGMFLISIVGTIWITLWTIQRGERSRQKRADEAGASDSSATPS